MEKDNKKQIENRILEIENSMMQNDFWQNKDLAQKKILELQNLQDQLAGVDKYDNQNVTINIFAGAGGEDAEDWVRMLLEMYMKFASNKKWQINFLDENQNDNGGYRSITFEIIGKKVYGILKHESGVHRLVRKSPFNSSGKRQTSFAMVEIIPQFAQKEFEIKDDDLQIEFTKSSGPGGQNVNKRETAVRIVHKPTGATTFISSERSQIQNKEKALEVIRGRVFNLMEKKRLGEISELSVSKNTQAQWGNQIRSYFLHPYKLVKDHRNNVETSDVESVLAGDIDLFVDSMKK